MKSNYFFTLFLLNFLILSFSSHGGINDEAVFKLNTFFSVPDGWLIPSEAKLRKQSTSISIDFIGSKFKYPRPDAIVITLPNFIGENKEAKTGRLKIEKYLEECSESIAKVDSQFLEKTKFGYVHHNICKNNSSSDIYQVISISDLNYSRVVSFVWPVDEIELGDKSQLRYKIAYGIRAVLPAIFCADMPLQCSGSQLSKQYGKYIEQLDTEVSLRMLSAGYRFNQNDWWENYYDQILNFLEFLPSQALSEDARCLRIDKAELPDGYFIYCDLPERISKQLKNADSDALVFDLPQLHKISISSECTKRKDCRKLEQKDDKMNPKYSVHTCQDARLLVKEARQINALDKLSVNYMLKGGNRAVEKEDELSASLNSLIASISLKIHFCSDKSKFMNNCDDIQFYKQEGVL